MNGALTTSSTARWLSPAINTGSQSVTNEETKMFKMIRIATLLAVSAVGIANAQAGAGGSLSECYDIVIASCNTKAHPQSCASGGMDECDEIHPTPMTFNPKLVFKTKTPTRG